MFRKQLKLVVIGNYSRYTEEREWPNRSNSLVTAIVSSWSLHLKILSLKPPRALHVRNFHRSLFCFCSELHFFSTLAYSSTALSTLWLWELCQNLCESDGTVLFSPLPLIYPLCMLSLSYQWVIGRERQWMYALDSPSSRSAFWNACPCPGIHQCSLLRKMAHLFSMNTSQVL